MINVKRFTSFAVAQYVWLELEKAVHHYPFQAFWYQRLFAETFCKVEDVYLLGIYDNKKLIAIGGFESSFAKASKDKKAIFLGMKQVLGGQDMTDYGDLLFKPGMNQQRAGEIWEAIVEYFKELGFDNLQLDFVREDSLTYSVIVSEAWSHKGTTLTKGSQSRRVSPEPHKIVSPVSELVRNDVIFGKQSALTKTTVDKQEVAPYLIVPSSWDEYLQSLERKERHELKRKIKRFEEQQAFHFCSKETVENDFKEFIRLHRLSDGAKEKFMSDEMEQFFWNIVMADKNDYRVDFCSLQMDGKCVASIMSFVGQGRVLLYNSGFDPEYAYYSVGLILHSYLIKKSIEEKLHIHDFLRGSERYKYDLGARDMQLYKILISNI